MAQIKVYNSSTKMVGLPDTTNVEDKQLRLYLDRLNQSLSGFQVAINNLNQFADMKHLVSDFLQNPEFLSFMENKIKYISKKEAEKVTEENQKKQNQKNKILKSISVSPDNYIMKPDGEQKDFDVIYTPSDILNYQKGVNWSSSDPNVATVNENGKVTSVSNGECIITVSSTYNTDISAFARILVANQYQITVYATIRWAPLTSGWIYTENDNPKKDDFVWNEKETIITFTDDITPYEAKAQAALGIVSSTEIRPYIVAQSKVVYWRDKEKDYANIENAKAIQTWNVEVCSVGSIDPSFYCELLLDDSGYQTWTGISKLYSKGFYGDPENATAEQKIEFSTANCLVAENIYFETPPRNVGCNLESYRTRANEDEEWVDQLTGQNGYMIATGDSVTLNYYDEYIGEEITEEWIQITTYDGKYPCWIGKGVWDGTEDGGRYVGCSTYKPYIGYNEEGYKCIISGVDRDGDARVRFHGVSSHAFKYNDDIWYEVTGEGESAYVFDLNSFFAWTVSPCRERDETVYTTVEEFPDKYGIVEDGVFDEAGNVKRYDEGVFSIKKKNDGTTYYTTFKYEA